mgnify:CR=1 FL=1
MSSITEIEGVGPSYASKLADAGVKTVAGLLKAGASAKGRAKLAEATGISGKRILRWVNHADLFRIDGVAGEHAELLEAAGVDTVVELATRKPTNLAEALAATNEERKLVRSVPTLAEVKKWVAQAKELPRVVTH